MDPDAYWKMIAEAVDEQWERAAELAEELLLWTDGSGFPPTITDVPTFDRIVVRQTCEAVKAWDVVS